MEEMSVNGIIMMQNFSETNQKKKSHLLQTYVHDTWAECNFWEHSHVSHDEKSLIDHFDLQTVPSS